jgi:hypothetical protein
MTATKTWNALTPEERVAAGHLFDALSSYDLLTGAKPEATRRFGMADLLAYVTGGGDDPALEAALAEDGGLRATLRRLLGTVALCFPARPAEAGSGAPESRAGEGFTLRVKAARSNPRQTHVTVRGTAPGLEAPKALFVLSGAGARKFPLPEARDGQDGTIQMLAESDSDLVKAIEDGGAELFLR